MILFENTILYFFLGNYAEAQDFVLKFQKPGYPFLFNILLQEECSKGYNVKSDFEFNDFKVVKMQHENSKTHKIYSMNRTQRKREFVAYTKY